ncbi:unnamed protein product [Orchesella dallaii]|uniref:O-acyltransferase WSD1 C-terminal domain-containing protein n=1 Tax=Orchesella dallaii TaxID=48710 RepID=A0ABP1QHZ1_9HEXA
MSPSLTFSPSPTIKDLDACSSLKSSRQLSSSSPLGNVRIDITSPNNVTVLDEKGSQKFSKITKVKGYFCQIGLFVLDLFAGFFCYIFGIALLFNVLIAAAFSWTLRLVVRLIFATFYTRSKCERYKLIERGADALWAVETGFGASCSNIVIGLTCKGYPNLEKIVRTFETKVLNFKTRLRVRKEDGAYIQEESGEEYEPYEKLRWIIVEKFLFFCLKKDLGFCAKNHFTMEVIEDENEELEARMQKVMEKCITTRMSQEMPQWRFRIVTKKDINKVQNGTETPEYGIVFTIHHSYGDGISWVQMFRYAFADHPVKPSIDPMGKSPSLSSHYFSSSEPLATRVFRWIQTILLFPHYFSRQMIYVWRETNFFHGPFVKNNGTCRWNSSLSMKQIKAIRVPTAPSAPDALDKNDLKAGAMMTGIMKPAFTALLSSCITAAFTRLFRDYKARVPSKVLAILPYADLPYRTLHPLNNFYSYFLPIPTSVTNSRARLEKCDKYTKSFNPPPTKPVNTLIAHLCGIMISPLQKLVGISARSTVGFSNVPGPAERIHLFDGDEVTNLILFPPLKYRTAIVVGFISYGDHLTMSICVDETVSNHSVFATRFMEYFQEELQSLIQRSKLTAGDAAAVAAVNCSAVGTQPDGISGSIIMNHKTEEPLISGEMVSSASETSASTVTSPESNNNSRDFVVCIQQNGKRGLKS